MARFANRPLQWSDVIGRFEAKSSAGHAHNALGLIGRLKDEGRKFWGAGSKELEKWRQYCDVMWAFLNSLRKRRDVDEQSLETAMREFVREFEHSTGRMYQMVFGNYPYKNSAARPERADGHQGAVALVGHGL